MDHGMDASIFSKFKQVFSGHYHHKSKKGNIQYLGNPYQMFWNDYKDPRGFHFYEPATNKLKFVQNPYEIFQKIYYNDSDPNFSIDPTEYSNSYVKIIVEEKKDYLKFENMVEKLYDANVIDLKIVETLVDEDSSEEVNIEVKDTLTLLNEYIDEVDMAVDKTDLKKLMRSLYIESCEVV
jgi:hypothetical protein